MNFLADESIDRPIVERLRDENYRVEYIVEAGPRIPAVLIRLAGMPAASKAAVVVRSVSSPESSRQLGCSSISRK